MLNGHSCKSLLPRRLHCVARPGRFFSLADGLLSQRRTICLIRRFLESVLRDEPTNGIRLRGEHPWRGIDNEHLDAFSYECAGSNTV